MLMIASRLVSFSTATRLNVPVGGVVSRGDTLVLGVQVPLSCWIVFDPTTATLQMNCGIANAIKRPTFPDRRFWIRWARFQRRRTPWTAGRRADSRALVSSVAACAGTQLCAYLIQAPDSHFGDSSPASGIG